MIAKTSLRSRTLLFVVVVCSALVFVDGWRSLNARSVQLREVEVATSNLANAMASHAENTVKEADVVLLGIVERVQSDGTRPAALTRLHHVLATRKAELPELDGLIVYDAKGAYIATAQPDLPRKLNNADREYFVFHRTHTDAGVHISTPIKSRSTGKWVIPVSRRINNADGSFGGVALATISIDYLSRFFDSLDIGNAGATALISEQGVMLVRRPFSDTTVGRDMHDTALFRAYQAHGPSGTTVITSAQDGVTRVNSYRKVGQYPLFATAALSKDEILADWWSDTLMHLTGIVFLVVMLGLFARHLIRQIELRTRAQGSLLRRTAELHQLNLLFSNVLRSASKVSIIATDLNGIITVFNEGAEQMLGYEADELVGKCTPALIHVIDEVAARGNELSAQCRTDIRGFRVFVHKPETDGSETREWTYVRKDGSQLPVSLVVTAMRDEAGAVSGYLGIAVDISERRAAEQELAASVETTRAILDTAINPVITVDAAGIVRSFNKAGETVFGYSAREMIGQPVSTLIPRNQKRAFIDYVSLLAREIGSGMDTGRGRELAGLREDGSTFPAHVSTGSMDVAGERWFVCVITDITQQQRQRSDLAAARDQALLAADAAELGIFTWNVIEKTVQWNDRMFEIYGLPPTRTGAGLDLAQWRTCVHPDDVDVTVATLTAALEGRDAYLPSFRIVLPGGEIRHIHARASVQRDADGHALRVTGINRDITAQHDLEFHLRDAKAKADAASAAKSSFLANMSHEIRTPMNAVLGMLQLMQRTELNLRQLDYVSKAHTAARSLLGLLNDILDYSKIEAGKLQLDLHPFELEPLMQDLGVVLAGNQGEKEVEVMFDLSPDLPVSLIGDSLRLQQVLINLSGNALKFTPKGQVVVSVHTLAREGVKVRLRVAVTDSGIGIDADQLDRIFEGFNQAEASTTRRFGGTGLGLVICKRLVALMGGELRVESEWGKGSRFWFDIDLEIADPESTVVASPARPLRLLIADDNAMAGELLARSVAAAGWHADVVTGGAAAVAAVRRAAEEHHAYDVVLMDWHMPEVDGLTAAGSIHRECGTAEPPAIIMVTAYGREVLSDATAQGDAPFTGFLTKPVTPKQLVATILRAVDGHLGADEPMPDTRAAPSRRLEGLNLLVVEDNALNRQVAYELLSSEGALVQLAEGGITGVWMVEMADQSFDAVLMDIQMPDIDGLEATRRIRSNPRFLTLPVIAMTANASTSDRDACLRAGMTDHVGKPIDIETLIPVLIAHTGGRVLPDVASPVPVTDADTLIEARASIVSRFGGNLHLIRSVLRNFPVDMNAQFVRLNEQVAAANSVGAASVLHAVKGSAGTMGARALSRLAGDLERELREGDLPSTGETLDDACLATLKRLIDQSAEGLNAVFADLDERDEPAAVGAMASAQWRDCLEDTVLLLESSNLKAIGLAETLASGAPETLVARCEEFLLLVKALDFPAAALIAMDMLERLDDPTHV